MKHKLDVTLQPGEFVIANGAVQFPHGGHMREWGFRSFRDFQGRDISARLPGWPPSKKPTEPPAAYSVKGILLTVAWTVLAVIESILDLLGGSPIEVGVKSENGDCFPVLHAEPGTIAFDAPWQLDPGRNKSRPRVILHMTDRRLLFTLPTSGRLLWEIHRKDVMTIERQHFYELKVTFVDGSWLLIKSTKDKQSGISTNEEDYAAFDASTVAPSFGKVDLSYRFCIALRAFPTVPETKSM
jgi:hypothetical protein